MLNAVLFDLDGTLINSLEDIAYSLNMALESHGFRHRTLAEVKSFVGNGADTLIRRALPPEAQQYAPEVYSTYRACYKANLCRNTKPYDGIYELIDYITASAIKCAVVTNKDTSDAEYIVSTLFGSKIPVVIGALKGVRKKKPDPEPVLAALSLLGTDKDKALYIGDSETDVLTAQNTQMKCIGCSWGFRERKAIESADYVADSPFEIIEIIKKIKENNL